MSTPVRRYSRGRKLVSVKDEQAGTTRYYHYDHQGTVQCLTDGTGVVTDRFAADAWGVQVKRTGTSINRHWYVGNLGYYKQRDVDYVRARWLHPLRAAWLNIDPELQWLAADLLVRHAHQRVRSVGRSHAGRSEPYSYSSSPVAQVDPSGCRSVRGSFPNLGFFASLTCYGPGLECCAEMKTSGDPPLPVFERRTCYDSACQACRKTENKEQTGGVEPLYNSMMEYCDRVSDWISQQPMVFVWDAVCLRQHVDLVKASAKAVCEGAGDRGECLHCAAAAFFQGLCGTGAARWISWCKEMKDLTDCGDSEFSRADWAADLAGIYNPGDSIEERCGRYLPPKPRRRGSR